MVTAHTISGANAIALSLAGLFASLAANAVSG
jgi:hypothetical protein